MTVSPGHWKLLLKWNGVRYASAGRRAGDRAVYRHFAQLDAKTLFLSGLTAPDDTAKEYPCGDNDLRPSLQSGVCDAGISLPNVNDGFAGAAPDLGAYEAGQPLPHYGPRE